MVGEPGDVVSYSSLFAGKAAAAAADGSLTLIRCLPCDEHYHCVCGPVCR